MWHEREITIERWTRGRTPMGEFRAYETTSGVPIPQLTGTNCGQMLLGVEKAVFLRSGFIRFTDLPVTQDETLRRRLNDLVTTGDESGQGETLAGKLRELKNKLRHNRTGLLPQAESTLAALEQKLTQLQSLQARFTHLSRELEETDNHLQRLSNHLTNLDYQAAQEDARLVRHAQKRMERARDSLEAARERAAWIPAELDASRALEAVTAARYRQTMLEAELRHLQPEVTTVQVPEAFVGMRPEEALSQASEDAARLTRLRSVAPGSGWIPLILSLGFFSLCVLLAILNTPWCWIPCLPGVLFLVWAGIALYRDHCRRAAASAEIRILEMRYGSPDPHEWQMQAQEYLNAAQRYKLQMERFQNRKDGLQAASRELEWQIDTLCGGLTPEQLRSASEACQALEDAQAEYEHALGRWQDLAQIARTALPPAYPDNLSLSKEDTLRAREDALQRRLDLQQQLGQCQGRMELLGNPEKLRQEAQVLRSRIAHMEDHYAAVEYAQIALANATAELQRRFAPRVAARAQELFCRLTDGRYDRFTLTDELSVNTGATGETTLHSARWRSDGTIDQLYLALRLAVACELTPDAPVILDDALVRFDDNRLRIALRILREEALQKQVILFTCQGRESRL